MRLIEENLLKQNKQAARPDGRRFYDIIDNGDGTADVYLRPEAFPKTTPDGITDYDIAVLAVKGVEMHEGLEEDIRTRYEAWCASAEKIFL